MVLLLVRPPIDDGPDEDVTSAAAVLKARLVVASCEASAAVVDLTKTDVGAVMDEVILDAMTDD